LAFVITVRDTTKPNKNGYPNLLRNSKFVTLRQNYWIQSEFGTVMCYGEVITSDFKRLPPGSEIQNKARRMI